MPPVSNPIDSDHDYDPSGPFDSNLDHYHDPEPDTGFGFESANQPSDQLRTSSGHNPDSDINPDIPSSTGLTHSDPGFRLDPQTDSQTCPDLAPHYCPTLAPTLDLPWL